MRFYEGVGVGVRVLKIEESQPESEVLCTNSTALLTAHNQYPSNTNATQSLPLAASFTRFLTQPNEFVRKAL
jgi:hypothetical protein